MFKNLIVFLFGLASSIAVADLNIRFVSESSLPYDYSPNNYDNSPNNYDNAINNYDNSSNNYDNSENNYDNAANNYDNSSNGNRRLILNNQYYGYYVRNGHGVMNFYSSSGKRMFYNPKKSNALFDAQGGNFVGVLASSSGYHAVFLTEYGQKVLILSQ